MGNTERNTANHVQSMQEENYYKIITAMGVIILQFIFLTVLK